MQTYKKATLSGPVLEVRTYDVPIIYGNKPKPRQRISEDENFETKDYSREISSYRAKRRIRQIVHANAYQWVNLNSRPFKPIFLTLTFAKSMPEVKEANGIFNKFIKRLNYKVNEKKTATLKYIVVVEFQKDTDYYGRKKEMGGSVHYHAILFNLPYIENVKSVLAEVWGQGFIKINGVNDVQHLSNYIAKYLTKQERDKRLDHKKYYFCSKGLNQPLEFRDEHRIELLLKSIPINTPVVTRKYKDHFGNPIVYAKYQLVKDPSSWTAKDTQRINPMGKEIAYSWEEILEKFY